jgi:hypothetical protein
MAAWAITAMTDFSISLSPANDQTISSTATMATAVVANHRVPGRSNRAGIGAGASQGEDQWPNPLACAKFLAAAATPAKTRLCSLRQRCDGRRTRPPRVALWHRSGWATSRLSTSPDSRAPKLESLRKQADGAWQFRLRGGPGLSYVIESSSDLREWSRLAAIADVQSPFSVSESIPNDHRFFRAVEIEP